MFLTHVEAHEQSPYNHHDNEDHHHNHDEKAFEVHGTAGDAELAPGTCRVIFACMCLSLLICKVGLMMPKQQAHLSWNRLVHIGPALSSFMRSKCIEHRCMSVLLKTAWHI